MSVLRLLNRFPTRDELLSSIAVEVVDRASPELVDAFARLVPQLSKSSAPPSLSELEEILASPSTSVLVARNDEGVIVGTLTLVIFRIPTAIRAWIEDVVVDEAGRKQGVGELLTTRALEIAQAAGARTVDLTSRASREAANRLYQRLGFGRRDTNIYRYELQA